VIFEELSLAGAYLIRVEPLRDERGWFARTYAAGQFRDQGLEVEIDHCAASFNTRAGTLRGMHYQAAPGAECKLVRCTRGAIYDVILDLRSDSETFCRWEAVELSPDSEQMLYIPEGLAHGFQTLVNGSEVSYQISVPHQPQLQRGVRWDDPAFGIEWPAAATRTISDRDRGFPDFQP
jgi:dTDP-4-dehydrorhamnose 3,5-epimerase